MDADRFDAIARRLGTPATRRLTLGGLLGAGLAAAAATGAAKKNHSGKKRKKRRARPGGPLGAPDCANPGPSRNMNGCDFSGRDFSGRDLSGSAINDAAFRNAELADANLADNGMRRTSLRGANLCSADLSSSALNNADFRGSDGPDGRPTNLTRATLRGSSCTGVKYDANTVFCATTMCNGKVRNDGCPPGIDPDDVCCTDADCGPARICRDGACIPDPGTCAAGQNLCRTGSPPCGDQPTCRCFASTNDETFCGLGPTCRDCSSDEDCATVTGPGSVCADVSGELCGCRQTHQRACIAPCGAACANSGQCGDFGVCCDGTCQRGDCCATADCAPNEACQGNICICQGCISRINGRCVAGAAWAECGARTRCAECHPNQVCAAGSQACVSCEFGGQGGTWCDARDDFANVQCGRACACARNPQGFGACFNTSINGYCRRGSEPICEFAADCVIEGLGTDCIVVGSCEDCSTACVTRCAEDDGDGDGEGPLRLVVLD